MQTYWSRRYQAGYLTVFMGLILITPLCGLMFDCGCTWPWAGLESHCNIHNPQAVHKCPWCVSSLAGAGSVGLAILLGFLASVTKGNRNQYNLADAVLPEKALITEVVLEAVAAVTWRVMLGLLVFFIVGVVTGWLSGRLLDYPYFFIGSFINM